MKRIAVLMTVFNRKETTLKCLRNLYGQSLYNDFSLTTYITNDGCTDGTLEAIMEEFPEVIIIEGNGTLYWNGGMYAAWCVAEKGDYDFYLWLNDDTILLEGALLELIDSSKEERDAAIIVGYTLDSEKKVVTYGPLGKNGKLISNVKGKMRCQTFNGNIVWIPKSAFNILGKNDSYYTHAIGDNDYGLRAYENDVLAYTTHKPIGLCNRHTHLPGWCDANIPIQKRFMYLYSPGGNGHNPFEFCRFQRKHFGIISAMITFISLHVHACFPIIWDKLLKRKVL